MGRQQFFVNSGFVIKSLELGNGHQFAQVGIPFPVLGQQHQVAQSLVIQLGFMDDGPGAT